MLALTSCLQPSGIARPACRCQTLQQPTDSGMTRVAQTRCVPPMLLQPSAMH